MDNMILGLLLLCERTIYQLRERIDQGLNLMYSSSMGSIQAAIKKLLQGGYIDFSETVENGKYKKIYRITQRGKERFLGWINAPMEEQCIRCPELVKVYFMGFAEPENRAEIIRAYLASLKERYCALEAICEEAKNMEIPEDGKELFQYQQLSALYGKDLYQFHMEWFENLLNNIESSAV